MPVCGACLFDCVALVLDLSLVPGLGSWVCVPSAAVQQHWYGSWGDFGAGFECVACCYMMIGTCTKY